MLSFENSNFSTDGPGGTVSYLVGLVGAGIQHSLSPRMHELAADGLGLRYIYKTLDILKLGITPEAASDLVRHAPDYGFAGLNITYPVKQSVMSVLTGLDEHAERIGAVNTIRIVDGKLLGYNTDWSGFRAACLRELKGVSLDTVVQVGAGGAGSAVAYALASLGVKRLLLSDLEPGRAAQLAVETARHFPETEVTAAEVSEVPALLPGADGLVNATPVGMEGHDGIPCDIASLEPRHWVADVIYRPLRTELIEQAARLGCRVMGGSAMVVGQAVDAFRLFTGLSVEPEQMYRYFDQLVAEEEAARSIGRTPAQAPLS
ncbi:MAG: shikimate dehydrogenase [Solirubrobacteraceae bacterium]